MRGFKAANDERSIAAISAERFEALRASTRRTHLLYAYWSDLEIPVEVVEP
jgi:hypothetical protein